MPHYQKISFIFLEYKNAQTTYSKIGIEFD